MGLDPFSRRVFLQTLDRTLLPARYSSGSLRRASALQRFLAGLHAVGRDRLEFTGPAELLVVSGRDWRRLFSYPYGLPFTRTRAGGGGVSIVAAADYPAKLLRRWDGVLLRAAQCGQHPPGDLPEFLDLLVGHEWGHAAANLSGLRARVKWFDEFMATYLFLVALRGSDPVSGPELAERFARWSRTVAAGSTVARADLGAFEYPLAKLSFDNLAWFQGVFTLFAWELVERRGWAFPLMVQARLGGTDRGDLARLLVEVEPGFKGWFATFGPLREREC
jgi:hypothetical protein